MLSPAVSTPFVLYLGQSGSAVCTLLCTFALETAVVLVVASYPNPRGACLYYDFVIVYNEIATPGSLKLIK